MVFVLWCNNFVVFFFLRIFIIDLNIFFVKKMCVGRVSWVSWVRVNWRGVEGNWRREDLSRRRVYLSRSRMYLIRKRGEEVNRRRGVKSRRGVVENWISLFVSDCWGSKVVFGVIIFLFFRSGFWIFFWIVMCFWIINLVCYFIFV